MLLLKDVAYMHPNRDLLFTDINLVANGGEKLALVGNNGVGKSTLLKIMAGLLPVSAGTVQTAAVPYYLPQLVDQYDDCNIAQALRINHKLDALKKILSGEMSEQQLDLLNDDWTIEERCAAAFRYWGLEGISTREKMGTLSGGQKLKVLLAGISIHEPEIILLDEPSNHLDTEGRQLLYQLVQSSRATIVVVSHDRSLLNLLNTVHELGSRGISTYGGNYAFYALQKQVEMEALNQQVKSREKELRKAKEVERESAERQQKLDARGKRKQEKAGLPTISMNTFRNNAEKSTARLKNVHAGKIAALSGSLSELRNEIPDAAKMKMGFVDPIIPVGKLLLAARKLNIGYDHLLWKQEIDFEMNSGDRIAVNGKNGSGKTTLIKTLLGELPVRAGELHRAHIRSVYIDQDYSLVAGTHSIYEQAQRFNNGTRQEHEIKIQLNRFLFTKDDWNKSCAVLSGGEKMRLMLCCLTIGNQSPDLVVLDEPTNNLDIQNIEILTAALNEYRGTLLVVSHDEYFLKEIGVNRVLELE